MRCSRRQGWKAARSIRGRSLPFASLLAPHRSSHSQRDTCMHPRPLQQHLTLSLHRLSQLCAFDVAQCIVIYVKLASRPCGLVVRSFLPTRSAAETRRARRAHCCSACVRVCALFSRCLKALQLRSYRGMVHMRHCFDHDSRLICENYPLVRIVVAISARISMDCSARTSRSVSAPAM